MGLVKLQFRGGDLENTRNLAIQGEDFKKNKRKGFRYKKHMEVVSTK